MTRRAIEPEHFPYLDFRRYTFSLALEIPYGVWVSGHSASRYDVEEGRVVVKGNMEEQARTAYEKIATILEAGGLGLGDVVHEVHYIAARGVEEYYTVAPVRRGLFRDALPGVSPVVVRSLLRPEALIEIEVVAARGGHEGVGAGWSFPLALRSEGSRAGSLLFVSAQFPLDPATGQLVGEGDIVAQARRIYENASILLRAVGLGWENVVKTVEFLTPEGLPRYRETAAVRREYLSPAFPAATGIIQPRLLHPGALLQVDFIAVAGPREVVNPGWDRYQRLTYVPGVRAGNLLFLSGQGALDQETGQVVAPGDVVGQARRAYENIARVLKEAGADLGALVQTVEFITPAALERYRETAALRREILSSPYPVATGVVCEALLRPEMLIEVDALALLP